jgi:hypothetical protein
MTPKDPHDLKGPDLLAYHADMLHTRVGAAFPGDRAVFRGHDLHADLQHLDWFSLCAFGIFGRHVPAAQLQLVSAVFVGTSYPDARLWNNRVAALAGSLRSTPNLGATAAQAISEATVYGRGNEFRALDFFLKARKRLDAGTTLPDLLETFLHEGGRMAGYGRPIASKDERMPLTLALARKLDIDRGPHLALAQAIDQYFEATGRPLRLNQGGLISAFAADFGWRPREFNQVMYVAFLAGVYPCYLEAADKPPRVLFATRCADVHYEGVAPRPWPASSCA